MSANVLRHGIPASRRHARVRKPLRSTRLRVESLEVRDVPAATLLLDFNTNTSPTPVGYTGVKPVLYSAATEHGWQSLTGMGALDRATANALTRDFQHGTDGTFLADVPDGTYNLAVGLGDPSGVRDRVSVWAEGQLLAANVKTTAGQFIEVRGRITVSDGQLTVRLVDGGGQNPRFALNYLTLYADDPNATGLFPDDATPAGNGSLGTHGAEVGLRFQADAPGFVTGIRFYKGPGNTGTHVGSLWTAGGTRLATATFTGETSSGWQEVRFANPVAVLPNTTYVASYWAPAGKYSLNLDYFAVSGQTSGHLSVLPGPQGGGGVYARGGGFPTNTNRSGNYWVDVVYASETTPPTVTDVTPATGAANVGTSTAVTVTFSEPMDTVSVNATTVKLRTAGGTSVAATVAYDAATRKATLTPNASLAASSTYTVLVEGGPAATSVQDFVGNPLAADFTSTFTTSATPLSANAGSDKTGLEGSSVSFTGSAAGGTGTLAYSWDFGDGTAAVTGTLTPTHTYADNGSYTVTLTVTDANNVTATDTAVVTVNNVNPTGTVSNTGPVNTGANVTIAIGSPADPSAADVAAGFRYSFDFDNNGTWEVTDSTTASASTSYSTAGNKTAKARIKDKDGGLTDYTTTVVVNNPAATGLVAFFPFDEGSGTTAASSVGGLTGAISGATWASGQTGGALSFDGVNDLVTVADANALDLTTGMTLEAWVRPTAIDGWETVILKEAGSDLAYALYADDNGETTGPRRPGAWIRQGSTSYPALGTAQLTVNAWTHLATTYDGTVLRLYVNGTLAGSLNRTGPINTSAGPLQIGGNNIWSEWFNGLIDEVRIYNRALSASEIQADMNSAPTVTAVSPTNGATGVLTSTNVTVTFSQAMDAATINTDTIQLKTAGGSVVPATVTYDAPTRKATLTPSAALSLGATYTILVEGGTGMAVKDTAGKAMAADFTSTFTTTDGTPPTANAGPDQTGNEGASLSFTGTSTGGTGQRTYSWDFGDGTAPVTGTLTPNHTYADNGAYTVTLTVTDQASNTVTDTAAVTVNNVDPTGSLSNNGPVNPNNTVTISFTGASDAAADLAAGFRYSFDFDNNGTWEVTDSTTASATTSYGSLGEHTIKGRIKDKDGGLTDYTTTVQVTNAQAPLAPTSLSAQAVSASEVNLTWDLGDSTDTAIVIERKTGAGGTYRTLVVLPGGENIYTDTSGWANTTYFYRMKTRNAQGDSAFGPEKSAATPGVGAGALNLVTGLTATATSPTTATITFTNTNSGSAPMHLLERSSDGMAYQVVASLGGNTSYGDVALTPGATYYYRVRATSWTKPTSDYAAPASVTLPNPAAGTPAAPSGVAATALSGTSVQLTWVNNAAGSTQFKIERANHNVWGGQTWTQIAVTAAGATSFTDTGLTPERPYIYRLRATNASGDSAWGVPASDVMESMAGTAVAVITASAGTGTSKTYNIGPGQTYATINSLDWTTLGPGDTVNIHYKAGGYKELFLISTRGTAAAGITIKGIPDPVSGALPVIDGAGATLAPQFRSHYAPLSGGGVIMIGTRPGYTAGYKPGYVTVENLRLQGAYSANTFTDFDGSVKNYPYVGAGVYLERTDHVTLKGNEITDNGEGVFGAGQSGFDRVMTDITLDSNYIWNNGNPGRYLEHNTYIEAIDIVYQFNRYGPVRSGAGGAGLKDRSVGTIIRYNYIEGGATQLQLPEAQNQFDLAATLPRYHKMWVYGNTLVTPPGNASSPVWFGGDQGLAAFNRKGVLYFYNNTVVFQSTRDQVYKVNLFRLSSGGEALDARNNILTALPKSGGTPSYLGLLNGYNNAYFGKNWVSPGYALTQDNSGFTGQAGGTANLIVGATNNPGFVDHVAGDFHLASGSAAIDAGGRFAGYTLPNGVSWEFLAPRGGKARSVVGARIDLGAFEFGN